VGLTNAHVQGCVAFYRLTDLSFVDVQVFGWLCSMYRVSEPFCSFGPRLSPHLMPELVRGIHDFV
jgi:hypothetical protein